MTVSSSPVLRFLGYPREREPGEGVSQLIRAQQLIAQDLLHPRSAVVRLRPEEAPDVGLEVEEAEELVLGLVTIGGELEAEVRSRLVRGDPAAALVLDAIGSAAVDEAVERVTGTVEGVCVRLVPGCGDWPLAAQRALFARLPADELGVELSKTLMMKPLKSSSFAFWVGARDAGERSRCAACELAGCRHRSEVLRGESKDLEERA